MLSNRELVRLACSIQAAIAKRCRHSFLEQQVDWQRLERLLEEVECQRRLVETCQERGWQHAAAEKQRELAQAVLACETTMSRMREHWSARSGMVPPLGELIAELQYLQVEFDQVSFVPKEGVIAIQTRSIVLERTDLGPFLIKLAWQQLAERCDIECFEIVALDPHPAQNNESVTHPHVRDGQLCAGDATLPVQRALEQGRLVDAFSLVNGVLHHYNSSSVYVALADWNGATCWSCGYETSEDDRYFCDRCEHDICSECISSCKSCDRYYCPGCQDRCEVCDDACCSRCLESSASGELSCCADCLKACSRCEESFGSSEIDKTTGLCPACRETDEEEPLSEESRPQPLVTT